MGINPPNPTFSDLPGTETATPAEDATQARYFPPYQQPIPRIPSIPAPRAQPKAAGGLNMDTLMPLLLMAAPFLEAHQPGYGLGLVSGVLQHQREQAAVDRNMVLTFAKEFANTPTEQMPAVRALLKSMGVNPERMAAIEGAFPIFRDPNYAQHETMRKYTEFFAPELAQHATTGLSMQDILSRAPERIEAARAAGLQVPGDIRTVQTGVTPGQSGTGELGTRTPPIAPQPITERRVVWPGQENLPTMGQLFSQARGTPFENAPVPPNQVGEWSNYWAKTAAEKEAHKKDYQTYLRAKMEDAIRDPGSRDLATLKAQMESPEAGMVFNTELMRARDAAEKAELARPVFVNIGGQMMPVSRDKAATIAQENAGSVMVPVDGTMVRMTGAQFGSYMQAQKRLTREEENRPPVYTVNGVKIRNESDYKTAILLHLLPMPTDPTARRLLLGTDPGIIDQRQAQTELRKVQAQIAYYQPMRGLYAPNIRAAMDAFINGADPKVLEPAIALLQRDQTKVGPNQLRAIDMATMLVGFTKQAQEWQRWATPPTAPTGIPGAGAAGPPVDPAGFAGQTIQGPDGKRWSSNGTAWSQAP